MDGVAPVPVRNPAGPEFIQDLFGIRSALKTPIYKADQMFTFIAEASANDEIARAEYLKSGALFLTLLMLMVGYNWRAYKNMASAEAPQLASTVCSAATT